MELGAKGLVHRGGGCNTTQPFVWAVTPQKITRRGKASEVVGALKDLLYWKTLHGETSAVQYKELFEPCNASRRRATVVKCLGKLMVASEDIIGHSSARKPAIC